LFDTAGLVTTYGSILFADHVPRETAEAVRVLEGAGYGNVGKTNLHEFAYGVTSQNPHFGTVPNPRRPGLIAGGSSGGSAAAVAAGLADVGLGTDSGGSIRIPAACCGLVGFKPTHGSVPLDGCFPLAPSFDHVGPLAETVERCVVFMEVFGVRRAEPEDVRIGLGWLDEAEPAVRVAVEEAAAAWFPAGETIDFPRPSGTSKVFMHEVADVHRELFAEHAAEYGPDVRAKIEKCLKVTDREYEAGVRNREEYRERALEALEGFDLLVTPTMPVLPPPVGAPELDVRDALTHFTYPINALGWPALAVPAGEASLQIVGRPGDDARVLAAVSSLV
jgi:aspartyl-tRNA(Asn)/glutamyl-tRNA(Gln) amidotransferase subunit A